MFQRFMEIEDIFPTSDEILAEGPYQCDQCGTIVSHGQALRLHKIKKHAIVQSRSDQRIQNPTILTPKEVPSKSKKFHCCDQRCLSKDKSFPSMKLLKQHYQKSHLKKSLNCPQCSKKFALARDLTFHLKKRCKESLDNEGRITDNEVVVSNDFTVKVLNNGKTLTFWGPMPEDGFSLVIRRSGNSGVHVEIISTSSLPGDAAARNLNSTQTDISCITQEQQLAPMFECSQGPSTSLWESDYLRQDVFCQTAPSSVAPTNDFGTQIDSSLAENFSPQMRHVETTMDLPILGEDWRSIETQTIWTNENSCYYNWYEEISSLPAKEDS